MNPNWFETFFEGLALDMWRGACTPEQTAREADFLTDRLELQPGMTVLDVPCGNGRHTIELAQRHGERLRFADLITHRFGLTQLEEAIDVARRGEAIKAVVVPSLDS